MNRCTGILLLTALALAGCIPLAGDRDEESEARRQYDLARTLEATGDVREAAHEYSIIGERFPNASMALPAIRRAALLYANPSTAARNDTLALRWLGVYGASAPTPSERELFELLSALVTQRMVLWAEFVRLTASADSLALTARRTGSAQSALSRRVAELEAELQQTVGELTKLKEVDVRHSRSKKRK
jgi:hypothetical protein